MSLANIQGKLSRTEMKNIMAGSGSGNCDPCSPGQPCEGGQGTCRIIAWYGDVPITCCI